MTTETDQRIMLAEAMGWIYQKHYGTQAGPIFGKLPAGGGVWTKPDNSFSNRFDPFTDANDDFSVLEWMREVKEKYDRTDGSGFDLWWAFARTVDNKPFCSYQIGDFARAAIAVLSERPSQ